MSQTATIGLTVLGMAMVYVFCKMLALLFEKEDFEYVGEYDDEGYMTGEGVLTSRKNGDVYKGGFKRGVFSCERGEYYFNATGRTYTGGFVDGKFEGDNCSEVYGDGAYYTGSFAQSARHGHGRMVYADGSVYVGDWIAGKKGGFGKMHWVNGNTHEGVFAEGRRNGPGVFVNAKKRQRIKGRWLRGQLQHKNDRTHTVIESIPLTDEERAAQASKVQQLLNAKKQHKHEKKQYKQRAAVAAVVASATSMATATATPATTKSPEQSKNSSGGGGDGGLPAQHAQQQSGDASTSEAAAAAAPPVVIATSGSTSLLAGCVDAAIPSVAAADEDSDNVANAGDTDDDQQDTLD